MADQQIKSIEDYLREGVLIASTVSAADIQSLIHKCHPVEIDHDLIRIGGSGDGGYLVPRDLGGISACFSPGVNNEASFESDLLINHGIPSHLADFSVDRPPEYAREKSFEKKFLGAYSSEAYISLEDWVCKYEGGRDSFDLILQMDIEGAEYEVILSTPLSILRRFRVVIIEFHDFQQIGHPQFFKLVSATLGKLFQLFYPVHIHPNNCGSPRNVNGVLVPPVFEMTLIRKDRCCVTGYQKTFPHMLDRPNLADRPDFELPVNWYNV